MSSGLLAREYIEELHKAYEKVLHYLCTQTDIALTHQQEHITYLMKENVFGGKMFRGCTVLYVISIISSKLGTVPDLEMGSIVGICIEMIHASFLIADDIIDQSSTRRGNPCWYKREDVLLSYTIFLFTF